MIQARKPGVIFLPGGIQPAALQYDALLKVLKEDIRPLLKDLEVYRDGTPPSGYTLSSEVEGLKHAADQADMPTFHLVAYSGGGAVALAFIGAYPERVLSLALSEPAVIPSQAWRQMEGEYWQRMQDMMNLADQQFMREFMRVELREGVPLPPPPQGDLPAWMANRPSGIRALIGAFSDYDLPFVRMQAYNRPVYIAVCALSNPIELRKAEILEGLFTDMRIEIYGDRHHFDPPQRAEPERFAAALTRLWEKSHTAK